MSLHDLITNTDILHSDNNSMYKNPTNYTIGYKVSLYNIIAFHEFRRYAYYATDKSDIRLYKVSEPVMSYVGIMSQC